MIKFNDLDVDNILMEEKLYKNILIHDLAYKNPYGANP